MDAKTLFETRKSLGLSKQEMAVKLAVSRQTYTRYETGDPIPKTKYGLVQELIRESVQKEENIHKLINSNDSKEIFIEFVEQLKGLRKDYNDLKVLFADYIENESKQNKMNQLSNSQLSLLSEIINNVVLELDENKKTDLKKSVKVK